MSWALLYSIFWIALPIAQIQSQTHLTRLWHPALATKQPYPKSRVALVAARSPLLLLRHHHRQERAVEPAGGLAAAAVVAAVVTEASTCFTQPPLRLIIPMMVGLTGMTLNRQPTTTPMVPSVLGVQSMTPTEFVPHRGISRSSAHKHSQSNQEQLICELI